MKEIIDRIRLRPKNCVWEITSKCNMECLHCASNINPNSPKNNELTLDEIKTVCRDLHELDCEEVTLSGGEALLHENWESIAEYLSNLGIRVALISNGLIIDEQMSQRIKKSGIYLTALSLDGMQTSHNFIRRNPVSFQRVCRAVPFLKQQKLQVNFVTHVNRLNMSELSALEGLAISLGVDVWRIQLGSPLGRLGNHPDLILEPEDLPGIADFIVEAKNRNEIKISVGDNVGYFSYHEAELRRTQIREGMDFWCGCAAGCLNIGIESNGNVKGCLSLQSKQFVEGNLRTESLKEIWNKKGNFSYTREFKKEDLHGYCENCEYGEICRGGCAFMAFGATGTLHNNPYCLYRIMKENNET